MDVVIVFPNTKGEYETPTATATISMKSVTDTVRAIATGCHTPASLTLTGAETAVTARQEAVPGHAMTPTPSARR